MAIATTTKSEEKQALRAPKVPPFVACAMHYLVVGVVSIVIHDAWVEVRPDASPTAGVVFGVYSVCLLVFRLATVAGKVQHAMSKKASTPPSKPTTTRHGFPLEIPTNPQAIVWYEMTWLCSVTLVMSAVSLVSRRPLLAWAYGLAVAIDQVLWYFDGLVYLLTGCGKTYVGVFNHILLVHTPWYYHLTTWHHVWTLPLLGWATCGGSSLSSLTATSTSTTSQSIITRHFEEWAVDPLYGVYLQVWLLSGAVMTLNVLSSRVWTPFALLLPMQPSSQFHDRNNTIIMNSETLQSRQEYHFHYLNVNLAYEVWKELSMNIAFLRIQQDGPSLLVYMGRLLTRWFLLNTLILLAFASLVKLSSMIIG